MLKPPTIPYTIAIIATRSVVFVNVLCCTHCRGLSCKVAPGMACRNSLPRSGFDVMKRPPMTTAHLDRRPQPANFFVRAVAAPRSPGRLPRRRECERLAAPQQSKMRLGVKSRSAPQSPPRSRSASVDGSADPVFEQTGRGRIRISQPRRATNAGGIDREE
jgi:hypothetical protein